MNQYELAVVLSPRLEETERKKSLTILSEAVGKSGGKVGEKLVWGKKEAGWYEIWQVNLPKENVAEFTKTMKMNESIIRHLLIKKG